MKRFLIAVGIILLVAILGIGYAIPEPCAMPCSNANSYNPDSYWTWPWTRGKAGHPHLGVDIFGSEGEVVVSQTGGLVVQAGMFSSTAGNMVTVLGPKWRIHTYMHLQEVSVSVGDWVSSGEQIGTLGRTGNAQNTPAHVHYEVITPIPYFWLYDNDYGKSGIPEKFSWRKMFWLNPADHLPKGK